MKNIWLWNLNVIVIHHEWLRFKEKNRKLIPV